MKKFLVILLGSIMALSLVACGKNKIVEIPKGEMEVKELAENTVSEILKSGYEIKGIASHEEGLMLNMTSNEFTGDMEYYKNGLEGKTVAELRDEYDISLSLSNMQNENMITMKVGDLYFECEIEAVQELKDEIIEDESLKLEEVSEIQNEVVKNVMPAVLNLSVILDEESAVKIEESGADLDMIKEMGDELTVKRVIYTMREE